MINHIVIWKLKDSALGNSKLENATKMKELLESLKNDIEGILKMEVGINICDSTQSYDIVLNSEFVDQESLDSYQVHPKHMEVGSFISEIRDERIVVDYKND